eukprot:TRINITY_DN569_c0_g2_i1.p1 TRINITY_DN569_c0_g2~~TRINITY_DN569_c0_g2_i1.p1  ORF type:complete len:100 (+),score=9.72 TRINITY_DN569_c0_g2_i1:365-664(+)
MHHKDGPAYHPRVAIITLQGPAMMNLKSQLAGEPIQEILMMPRSLMIFEEDVYTKYYHGIEETDHDIVSEITITENFPLTTEIHRTTRISLTIRYVPEH